MFGTLGAWEIGIIAVVIILIFGVGKISGLGRDLGSSIKEFRRAVKEEDVDEKSEWVALELDDEDAGDETSQQQAAAATRQTTVEPPPAAPQAPAAPPPAASEQPPTQQGDSSQESNIF